MATTQPSIDEQIRLLKKRADEFARMGRADREEAENGFDIIMDAFTLIERLNSLWKYELGLINLTKTGV